MLDRADCDDERIPDEQAKPTSPLLAAALRQLDEQRDDDEQELPHVEAVASPASLSSDERAAARRRLLEELAALDAAEPIGADTTGATVECRASGSDHAREADRSATVSAERAESAPAIPAGDFRDATAAIDAEFVEIAPASATIADQATIAELATAPVGDLFGATPAKKPKGLSAAEIAAAFARFWTVYPLKVGKGDAQKAFEAEAKKGVDLEHVIRAAERYGAANRAAETERRFLKHPGGWIRTKRYDDDPATLPQPIRQSGAPRGGYSGSTSSLGNYHRGMDRILEQAQEAERAKRDAELARADTYRNSKSPW